MIKPSVFLTELRERNSTNTIVAHFKLRDRHMNGYKKNTQLQVGQSTKLFTNKATYCHTATTAFKKLKIQTLKLPVLRTLRYKN